MKKNAENLKQESPHTESLGLVMSGGGARAAYQVGFLRTLARHYGDLNFPVITGVSSGAINAAFLANEPGLFQDKVDKLADIWGNLTIDNVFRVDSRSVASHVLRWGLRLILGGASNVIKTRSLVDTDPLRRLMIDILKPEYGKLMGIDRNINDGKLKAIAITASSYTSGQSISWVKGTGIDEWERGHRKSIFSDLTVDHIMASASLPMLFPSIYVDGSWYGDGGIRLTAPLSPAIHMGAKRLLAISTRHIAPDRENTEARLDDYPSPAKVMGAMYSSIFLDVFDNDALRLERINHLLESNNGKNPENLEQVKLLLLRPSEDLGDLASQYEPQLPSAFRFMTRGWGTQENQSTDMLSLVMFQPDYLQHLIEMGEKDAEARMDEIHAFLCSD
ncbi:MAG: NTE family protein [Gammaproteobacteria bacterium]|jgi:NTE family protein